MDFATLHAPVPGAQPRRTQAQPMLVAYARRSSFAHVEALGHIAAATSPVMIGVS
jgi:hypothetical protein